MRYGGLWRLEIRDLEIGWGVLSLLGDVGGVALRLGDMLSQCLARCNPFSQTGLRLHRAWH